MIVCPVLCCARLLKGFCWLKLPPSLYSKVPFPVACTTMVPVGEPQVGWVASMLPMDGAFGTGLITTGLLEVVQLGSVED